MPSRCLILPLSLTFLVACGNSGRKASLPSANPSVPTNSATSDALPLAKASPSPAAQTAAESPLMTASTEAHRRSVLVAPVGGIVERVLVREGMFVDKDARLVELQPHDFVIRVRTAEAAVQAAAAQVDGLTLARDRLQSLRATDSVPQSDFDTIDAQFKAARAQLAQARAGLDMARKVYRDSVIVAPYDGLVIKRMINEGEFAAAMPPTPLVVIEEIDPLDLRVLAPATRAGQIHEGTPLVVRFPALNQEIRTTVTRVTPWVDPRNRTFAVIAELPNADHALMPGLYAEARVAEPGSEASR